MLCELWAARLLQDVGRVLQKKWAEFSHGPGSPGPGSPAGRVHLIPTRLVPLPAAIMAIPSSVVDQTGVQCYIPTGSPTWDVKQSSPVCSQSGHPGARFTKPARPRSPWSWEQHARAAWYIWQYVITILGKPAMGLRPSLSRFRSWPTQPAGYVVLTSLGRKGH